MRSTEDQRRQYGVQRDSSSHRRFTSDLMLCCFVEKHGGGNLGSNSAGVKPFKSKHMLKSSRGTHQPATTDEQKECSSLPEDVELD